MGTRLPEQSQKTTGLSVFPRLKVELWNTTAFTHGDPELRDCMFVRSRNILIIRYTNFKALHLDVNSMPNIVQTPQICKML